MHHSENYVLDYDHISSVFRYQKCCQFAVLRMEFVMKLFCLLSLSVSYSVELPVEFSPLYTNRVSWPIKFVCSTVPPKRLFGCTMRVSCSLQSFRERFGVDL
jgi:hypothetical protein